jgi:hypothetical protein
MPNASDIVNAAAVESACSPATELRALRLCCAGPQQLRNQAETVNYPLAD